jgi:methyltransferase (TIGR00027 family)
VRSRFAEDAVAAAVVRGAQQLVVLGAGLDTFAYRSPFGARVRVFEVDHPATQAWKRERLVEAAIAPPEWLTFAPIDFERETLADGLAAAGLDASRQTFFTWLGVTPYLTEAAIWSTLGFIASVPGGAHVVFDYVNPPDSLTETNQADHHRIAERVQAMGEPWVTFFDTAALRAKLHALGFGEVEDLGPREIASRYFPARADLAPEKGAHVVRATTVPL